MRYGILSDVHGNLEALRASLDCLAQHNIDQYVFLGDAVGYGANPNEVCDLLRKTVSVAIVGNHDAAVSGRMRYDEYYDAAREALDWCKQQLSDDNLQWLQKLPYKERHGDVEFCHGAPIVPEVFDYLFGPEQVVELLDYVEELAPVTFIGHSHLAISFRIYGAQVTPMVVPAVECDAAAKFIITAGSVGQPRDRDPRACCGIYDTDSRVFEYQRVDYDVQRARRKILEAGLSTIFGDRLLLGV